MTASSIYVMDSFGCVSDTVAAVDVFGVNVNYNVTVCATMSLEVSGSEKVSCRKNLLTALVAPLM